MLLSAVSVLVVAQSSSEIPEGLMNNPVFNVVQYSIFIHKVNARYLKFDSRTYFIGRKVKT